MLGANRAVLNLLHLAYGYGRLGDVDEARRLFDEVSASADSQNLGVGDWALAHPAAGNTAEALEWLEQGAEKARRHEPDIGFNSLTNIRMNATDDPLQPPMR